MKRPIASVLIPSRGRADLLRKSVPSWQGPGIEILVAIDEDDPTAKEYRSIEGIRLFEMVRYGYQNLHEYYNALSDIAKGKWLMLGNDDAFMLTPDWQKILEKHDHTYPQVLNVWNERDNLFPIISRAWYEATGHYSRNTHADSWVQQTAELIDKTRYIQGIEIKHHGEELQDATHQEVCSVVGQSSEAYRRMSEERKEDARKVNEYIKRKGLDESY